MYENHKKVDRTGRNLKEGRREGMVIKKGRNRIRN
jgi:hypothetical protein